MKNNILISYILLIGISGCTSTLNKTDTNIEHIVISRDKDQATNSLKYQTEKFLSKNIATQQDNFETKEISTNAQESEKEAIEKYTDELDERLSKYKTYSAKLSALNYSEYYVASSDDLGISTKYYMRIAIIIKKCDIKLEKAYTLKGIKINKAEKDSIREACHNYNYLNKPRDKFGLD